MIQSGRFTAQHEGPIVVFLIGMRINNWLKVREWWPVATAMQPMINYLYQHPESGFLGLGSSWISPNLREVMTVQYWRSAKDLERFANEGRMPPPDRRHSRTELNLHPEAWRKFFQQSFKSGAVGIWHETYQVEAGAFETIYGNMPLFGFAKATKAVPVRGKLEHMRGRLGQEVLQD